MSRLKKRDGSTRLAKRAQAEAAVRAAQVRRQSSLGCPHAGPTALAPAHKIERVPFGRARAPYIQFTQLYSAAYIQYSAMYVYACVCAGSTVTSRTK